MKRPDSRSFAVALVHDSLVNAHLNAPFAGGPSAATGPSDASGQILDLLITLEFGLVQLPTAGLPAEKAARAIELALDQMQDYAASGYRTIWLKAGTVPGDAAIAAHVLSERNRRNLNDLEIIELGSASVTDATRLAITLAPTDPAT